MTRVFYASTLFAAMNLAAGLDAGLFGDRSERRLLLVSNNADVPELAPGFEQGAAFATLRDRFDDIVSWNDVIAPLHPAQWQPPAAELPMLSRLITETLGLRDGVTELVVESIAVAPAAAISALLRDCPITVYADGLLGYAPTRNAPPVTAATRIERLVHLELVPSLTPLLLREHDVATVPLPADAFARVVSELPAPDAGDNGGAAGAAGAPVLIGQYLAQLGVLTVAEETELHLRMLRGVAARGERCVVFRPHPAAARAQDVPLRDEAVRLGVQLVVADDGLPVEAWFAAARPSLVVSCFSTALFTAAVHHGCAVATVGADLVLDRLAPFEDSNRIPATIVAASLPALGTDGTLTPPADADLPELVEAVGYCMQAARLPELRDTAVAYLAGHERGPYFKKRRLETLGLLAPPAPAAPPPRSGRLARQAAAEARGVARRARAAIEARRPVERG